MHIILNDQSNPTFDKDFCSFRYIYHLFLTDTRTTILNTNDKVVYMFKQKHETLYKPKQRL